MARKQSYSKFEISSLLDPSSQGYNPSLYDKDIKAIVNAVKSSLPQGAYLSVGNKAIEQDGKLKIDIYTHSSESSFAEKAIDEKLGEMYYKGSSDKRYSVAQSLSSASESKALSKAEKEEQKKVNKETGTFQLASIGKLGAIVMALKTVTDITRRILSVAMNNATEAVKTATLAHNIGLGYNEVREYGYIEKKSGLEKGVISNAISGLKSQLGNEFNLNQKALDSIAVLLGTQLSDVFMSELRGGSGENSLAMILDRANEIVKEGKSPTGEYVGEAQARVKMYTYLRDMFPEIADIFAKMQEQMTNVNSIYYKSFGDFASWKEIMLKGVIQPDTVESGLVQTLGEYTKAVESLIDRIKEAITINVAPELIKILRKIADSRFFLSAEENEALNKQNKAENEAYIADLESRLKSMPSEADPSWAPQQKRVWQATRSVLQSEIDKAKKENEKYDKGKDVSPVRSTENMLLNDIGDITWGLLQTDLLQGNASYELVEKVVKDNYSEADINKAIADKKEASIQAEIERQQKEVLKRKEKIASDYHKSTAYQTALDKAIKDYKKTKKLPKKYVLGVDELSLLEKQIMADKFGGSVYKKEYGIGYEWTGVELSEAEKNVIATTTRMAEESKGDSSYREEAIKDLFIDTDRASVETEIAIEQAEKEAKLNNPFYAMGFVTQEVLDKFASFMNRGVANEVVSRNIDGVGGKKAVIELLIKDDKGKVVGTKTIYEAGEQTIFEGSLGTVVKNADGSVEYNAGLGDSASSVR